MNIIRTVKIPRKAQKLFGLLEEASVSKSMFKSKTFWWNMVSGVVELSGILSLPPGTATVIAAVGNILLRRLTSTPVHVVTSH